MGEERSDLWVGSARGGTDTARARSPARTDNALELQLHSNVLQPPPAADADLDDTLNVVALREDVHALRSARATRADLTVGLTFWR